MKLNNLPVVTVKSNSDGLEALKLTEEPFAGIIYTYGKVSFEEGDALKINFEYNSLNLACLFDQVLWSEEHTNLECF